MSDALPNENVHVVERPLAEVKRYARRRYALFAGHLVVGVVFLAAMMAGASRVIADWARDMAGPGAFLTGVFFYFAAFSLAYAAATLPLSFYGEYLLEHQFGLSRESLRRWLGRRAKKWLFSFLIALPLVLLSYWLLRRQPQTWWIAASAAWILLSYVLTKFAPQVLVPMFYKLERVSDPVLERKLAELAAKAGVRLTGAYRIDLSRETRKANAAVIGLGSTRRVVLGDTLLAEFTHDEIAAVFAHELGHVAHAHLLKGFVWMSLLAVASLYAGSQVLGRAAEALGIKHVHDVQTFPILVAVLAAISLVVMPLEKWYSRRRERQSDEYALRATGRRDPFISAMKKLGLMNLSDVNPNKVAELLLFSHPPIRKRIEFAKRLDLVDAK